MEPFFGIFRWPMKTKRGQQRMAHSHWPWPTAVAIGRGQWPWPLAVAIGHGHWPWPMAMANGHGHWPWPLVLIQPCFGPDWCLFGLILDPTGVYWCLLVLIQPYFGAYWCLLGRLENIFFTKKGLHN